MREILFRGKRTDNGEWVYGYLYITHKDEYEIGAYNKKFGIERVTHIVIPETVGQYTGITDKNGDKVFEGDIIAESLDGFDDYGEPYKDDINFVEFSKESCAFVQSYGGKYESLPFEGTIEKYGKVIGNIFDNPELII